jgi:hypothetical protein
MGHDTHFLSRLQRVEGRALDLALGLYRDTPLLRWTLQRLPLADNDEVVALPLNNTPEPPYALVSRKGKFITCLASGMFPTGRTRVTWEALTAATRELEAWRGLVAEGQDRTNLVMARMCAAGPWLAREDFEDLLVISALVPQYFLEDLRRFSDSVLNFRQTFRPQVFKKSTELTRKSLSMTWKFMWATSHASIVHVESMVRQAQFRQVPISPDQLLIHARLPAASHLDGLFVRAGWCVGRLGRLVMEESLTQVQAAVDSVAAGKWTGFLIALSVNLSGLLAMTVRHPELAAEVRSRLEAMVPPDVVELLAQHPPMGVFKALVDRRVSSPISMLALTVGCLREAPEFATGRAELARVFTAFMQRGEGMTVVGPKPLAAAKVPVPAPLPEEAALAELMAPPDPSALASLDEVHPDLLHVIPFNTFGDSLANIFLFPERLCLAPLLANRDAVGQFFPRAQLEALSQQFKLATPLDAMQQHLEGEYRMRLKLEAPPPRPATPGRNEACSCGSGQKYKKCCGGVGGPKAQ